MPARIFIVEDNAVMRSALKQFLSDVPDFEVSGATETAEEALQMMDDAHMDLALIDTQLPGMNGIELVQKLRTRYPSLPCLMYSGHGETTYVKQALTAGACGYALKGNPDDLPRAIRHVLAGTKYISESLQNGW